MSGTIAGNFVSSLISNNTNAYPNSLSGVPGGQGVSGLNPLNALGNAASIAWNTGPTAAASYLGQIAFPTVSGVDTLNYVDGALNRGEAFVPGSFFDRALNRIPPGLVAVANAAPGTESGDVAIISAALGSNFGQTAQTMTAIERTDLAMTCAVQLHHSAVSTVDTMQKNMFSIEKDILLPNMRV